MRETFDAETAWRMLVEDKTAKTLRSIEMFGSYHECLGGVSFGCGEPNCCDDYWETKEEFLRYNKGYTFYRE